jgi:amino acid adenylation domain-containing protein
MSNQDRAERLKSLSPEKRRLLLKLLQEQAAPQERLQAIPRRRQDGPVPLSFAQQRLWFIDRLTSGNPSYNIPLAVQLEGALDVAALARSLREIVRRHEVLRTRFVEQDGQAVQMIDPPREIRLSVIDLQALPWREAEVVARQLRRDEILRPFDLARGRLLRAALLRQGSADHLLLLEVHHIVFDGWSTANFMREISVLYHAFAGGLPSPLPELPIQYADYAVWQRSWLAGAVLEKQLSYWCQKLAGIPALLELPCDRPRPATLSSRGAAQSLVIAEGTVAALERLGGEVGASLFMTVLAAFQTLLGRLSGQSCFVVGAPLAGRTRTELEPLIGLFVNTLALRADLPEDTGFRLLLTAVVKTTLDAYDHQDLPFEKLIDELDLERSLSYSPLFQTVFTLQNTPPGGVASAAGSLRVRPLAGAVETTKFDLTLALTEVGGGLAGGLEYAVDLFDASTIDRWLGCFQRLLEAIVADPLRCVFELPFADESEQLQMLAGRRDTAGSSAPPESLYGVFRKWVERTPDTVAVVGAGTALSYRELAERAQGLAGRLAALAVGPGARVGLCAGRDLEMVVGILGILEAGCAYVPVDPAYPQERIAFLLADSGAAVVVADHESVDALKAFDGTVVTLRPGEPRGSGALGPLAVVPAELLAYVIYTSGSTGQPKGVVVSHANVLELFAATEDLFGFGAADVWTLFHSYAFDFSVWELWGALLYGGRLVVVPHRVSRSPESFHGWLLGEQVTILNQTPSAFRQLIPVAVRPGEDGAGALRWVIFGGEALDPRSLALWWQRHGERGPGLVNMYGITETTVHVTYRRLLGRDVLSASGSVIGAPIPSLSAYVLDRRGQPAPLGVWGELAIAGAGLSQGYLGHPELTAERFVPDALSGVAGGRLYRSGDLGRWRASGELEYLGRRDHQVKIRGFRIELGEIESTLGQHPAVQEGVVVARQEDSLAGDRRLVAYYTVRADTIVPRLEELRAFLWEHLPEHMVPAVFVRLDSLPLTPHGKVDRRALPAPDGARPDLGEGPTKPRNPVESLLCEIWAQVLGIAEVGIHDNFFSLGGDSILSLRVSALAQERGLALGLADFFLRQTVAELALAVADPGALPGRQERPATLPFALVAAEDRASLPDDLEDAYPMAMLQFGMMYHMALSPESPVYHNVDSWHLRLPFAAEAFGEAVREVVMRHPILRTSFDFASYSEPLQLVHREASLPIPVEDLRHLSRGEQDEIVRQRMAREKQLPLDFSRPPQLRFIVHLRTEESFQLTLVENHAIFDGWSLHACLAELFERYTARLDGEAPPIAPPLTLSYRDYVALEREAMESEEAAAFWAELLDGSSRTELPPWPAPSPLPGPPRIRSVSVELRRELLAELRGVVQRTGIPLKNIFLAAHFEVLCRMSGQSDLVTGLVCNGRQEEPGGDQVLGLYLNTLPLRLHLQEGSWLDLAWAAFAAEQRILPFRRYPHAALQRQRGAASLFEVVFNFVQFHVVLDMLRSGRLEVIDFQRLEGASFKVMSTFSLSPDGTAGVLHLEYDAFTVPRVQAEAMAASYERVLSALAADPAARRSGLSALSAAELHHLAREWGSSPPLADAGRLRTASLAALVGEQAVRKPQAVAVVFGGARLTYGELDRRSDRIASYLQSLGVGPEVLVGLCAERSLSMVAGLFGVLKAGGAYVPLDPTYPPDRLAYILRDSGATVLLTERHLLRTSLEGPCRVVLLDGEEWSGDGALVRDSARPENLAYLIYTSGSTGRPKAVAIEHRSAVALALWARQAFSSAELSGVLAATSICFDLSVFELLVPLAWGGTVILAHNPLELAEMVAREEVRLVNTVPSAMTELLAGGGLPRSVRTVNLAGEALRRDLAMRICEQEGISRLLNLYGPSEDTTYSTWSLQSAADERAPAIGRSIAGKRLLLLDQKMQPVPVLVTGEIFLGGIGLARGYFGRPELTAERFVPDPFADEGGERLYRTGDLGRFRPDGEVEFLGRVDHQVKLRGFRVEPGEIDAVLARHPARLQALTLVREDVPGDPRLVSYVVPSEEAVPAVELRRFLRSHLPEYMVPAAFVPLDALPLLPNGKVNRQALPAPGWEEKAYAAPQSALEEELAALWREVMHVPRVGRDDNFFDLGGHSLLMVQLRRKMERHFARSFTMLEMFRYPTVSSMAAYLEGDGVETVFRPSFSDRGAELREGRERQRQRLERRPR